MAKSLVKNNESTRHGVSSTNFGKKSNWSELVQTGPRDTDGDAVAAILAASRAVEGAKNREGSARFES